MRVWLTKDAEPIPTESGAPRLMRTGAFAQALVEAGHDVTWFSSAYGHYSRSYRADAETAIAVSDRYRIVLLHPGHHYERNASMARVRYHRGLARRLVAQMRDMEPPDIIVSALPVVELARESARFASANGIPFIVDVRDLVPDHFLDLVPRIARPLLRIALQSQFSAVRSICRSATAVWGQSSAFVQWGLRNGGRQAGPWDQAFALAFSRMRPGDDEIRAAEDYWDSMGIASTGSDLVVSFAGTIGACYSIEEVIDAARELEEADEPIKFVICGTGDTYQAAQDRASGLRSILLPGWLDWRQLWVLMQRSHVGLLPLARHIDERTFAGYPNKGGEYLSHRLPIVSSTPGPMAELLSSHGCGVQFERGSGADLARVLTELAHQPARREAMGHAAETAFSEVFDATLIYPAMVEACQRIARDGQSANWAQAAPQEASAPEDRLDDDAEVSG